MAATHAVNEVLDIDYVPGEPDYDFTTKNTFMYSVFTRSLCTARSKACLHGQEHTHDAQAVYKALVHTYSDGTMAALTAQSLEDQLRSMKLDKTWTKKLVTFLITWNGCLQDLETVSHCTVP